MAESSNGRRKPGLDLQICYSGFKVEELEYIGMSRTHEDQEDDFLDTFNGKLHNGDSQSDDDDRELMSVAIGEYEPVSASFSGDGYRSYRCSTPTLGIKRRGSFLKGEDLSGFNEYEYVRNFPTNLDSGIQTQNISAASFFGDEIDGGCNSLENLVTFNGIVRGDASKQAEIRKKIALESSEICNPYSDIDELELSIEEDDPISQENSSTTFGTLKRRLSLKVLRRNLSAGLFGSYYQRAPEPVQSKDGQPTKEQPPLLTHNKPVGPVNIWFRKFRNRHFI